MLPNVGCFIQSLVGCEATHPIAPTTALSVQFGSTSPVQVHVRAMTAGSEAWVSMGFLLGEGRTNAAPQIAVGASTGMNFRDGFHTVDAAGEHQAATSEAQRKAIENEVSPLLAGVLPDVVVDRLNEKVERALEVASEGIIDELVKRIRSGVLKDMLDELVQHVVGTELSAMRFDIEEVESSIREIESHDEEISDLESRLDDVEDSSNSFEARIDSLVEENASLRVSIDELTARVNRSETPRRAKRCRAKSAASAAVTSAECDTTTLDGTK